MKEPLLSLCAFVCFAHRQQLKQIKTFKGMNNKVVELSNTHTAIITDVLASRAQRKSKVLLSNGWLWVGNGLAGMSDCHFIKCFIYYLLSLNDHLPSLADESPSTAATAAGFFAQVAHARKRQHSAPDSARFCPAHFAYRLSTHRTNVSRSEMDALVVRCCRPCTNEINLLLSSLAISCLFRIIGTSASVYRVH